MPAQLIDGKKIAAKLREKLKAEIAELKAKHKIVPGLAAILDPKNSASQVYVGKKEEACKELGIYSDRFEIPEGFTEKKLISVVEKFNKNKKIHGILVQLPLPKGINERDVLSAVKPEKDVDGFHTVTLVKLFAGEPIVYPCTPKGIMKLIDSTGIQLEGKHAVVVGRSNIVGKPVAMMLLERNATVSICHSRTKNLGEITRQADVLVAAVGKAGLVTKDMVKPGAIVIDVGINKTSEGRLAGDVAKDVADVAGYLTPVPGGVGPMTVACLMENTVEAAKRSLTRS